MARENIIRVRVDDLTDEALEVLATFNGVPKAQIALHFLLKGIAAQCAPGAETFRVGQQDYSRRAA